MERIVIEVDEATGKKWELSSRKRKESLSQEINVKLARDLADTKEDFIQYLDELRLTMKERGLTEEKLQEILNDE